MSILLIPQLRTVVIPAVLWGVLLGCGACTDRSPGESQDGVTAAPSPAGPGARNAGDVLQEELLQRRNVPLRVGREWFVATGELDESNRYSSAVQVYENQLGPEEVVRLCSGALVSPRLVLTAASCLCRRREVAAGGAGKLLSDSTACATAATIKTVTYAPSSRKGKMVSLISNYSGAARIHPAFKMVLDEHGNVISSEADLAVIALEEPVELPAVELAEIEVKLGEPLILAGHGYDESASLGRRFSTNPVTKVLEAGGRVAFAQPPGYAYRGARGGPCLRETGRGAVLVGVLGALLGQEASFTSVSPYRIWLREEIRRVAEAGDTTLPASP